MTEKCQNIKFFVPVHPLFQLIKNIPEFQKNNQKMLFMVTNLFTLIQKIVLSVLRMKTKEKNSL